MLYIILLSRHLILHISLLKSDSEGVIQSLFLTPNYQTPITFFSKYKVLTCIGC